MENEIWKDVIGYEGLYKVSNLGALKSFIQKKEGKIIKTSPNKEGYHRIKLWRDGAFKTSSIHREVLNSFVPNVENKPRVNHKDNNPSNNFLSNLEWATHQEDIDHKVKQNRQNKWKTISHPCLGKKGEESHMYGKRWSIEGGRGRCRLVLDTQTGVYYEKVREAAKAKNIKEGILYNMLIGNKINNSGICFV